MAQGDRWLREIGCSGRWVDQGDGWLVQGNGWLMEMGGSGRLEAQGAGWLAQGDGLRRKMACSGRWVAKLVERLLAAAALWLRIQTRHKKSQMATTTLVRKKNKRFISALV